jgi:uncharacterized RDD family membrane protein YckC
MPETEEDPHQSSQIKIARWSDRFFAWLIDYVIVFAGAFAIFFVVFYASNFENLIYDDFQYESTFDWAPISLVFLGYWIILEYKTGQSIGKMALQLKITNLRGEKANLKEIVISSFGKSFLLPIDIILGWIFTNKKRQRIFNKIGNTIIIKLEREEKEPENITYKMD